METIISKTKQELSRRRYSKKTADAYSLCLKNFFNWIKKHPRTVTKKDIENFLYYLDKKKKAGSTMNLHLSAIKFYFNEVLHRNIHIKIKYSKRRKRIPDFLNYNELYNLINAIDNEKHKLLIELMYSSGMRVNEVVKLKIKDFYEDTILIRSGKGNKDRFVTFANKLKKRIHNYIKTNNLEHNNYLFSGRKGHLHVRSVQELLKYANRKARINKNIHPHILRHSYGTHAVMQGKDLIKLQHSMGHKDFRTTLGYTHMNPELILKSPYDKVPKLPQN